MLCRYEILHKNMRIDPKINFQIKLFYVFLHELIWTWIELKQNVTQFFHTEFGDIFNCDI